MNLFKLLFTTQIPESLRYKSFTPQHLILLLLVFSGVFFTARYFKSRRPEQKENLLRIFTWALPSMYLFRFTVFLVLDIFVEPQMSFMDRLPFHLCALNAIVMPLALIRMNKLLLNYIYAVALPGAVAAMITPAMSYYGRYAYFSWQVLFFFIDHGLMALIPVLAVTSGLLRPEIRMMPKVLMFFAGYAALIYPVNKILGQNYLFLNYPDEGTVMALFSQYLGNPGYLLPMTLLAVLIVSIMYIPWAIHNYRNKQAEQQDA